MIKKIGLSGAPTWDMEAFFQSINAIDKVTPGLYYLSKETFALDPKDFVEMVVIEYDTDKIKLEEILDIHFLTFFPTVNSFEKDSFFPRCRSLITYYDAEEKFLIDTFLLGVEKKYKETNETVHVKVIHNQDLKSQFVALTAIESNLYLKDMNNPYVTSRIIPKLDKIKKKYPQYHQELSPWTFEMKEKEKDDYLKANMNVKK